MVLSSVWIRPGIFPGLILFFIFGCSTQKDHPRTITVSWEDERAIGMIIPSHYISDLPGDSITHLLQVRLSIGKEKPPILGSYEELDDGIIFRPLIPFTRGLTYEVSVRNVPIGVVEIPFPEGADPGMLKAIYPSQDTLPENLLKFYFEFSRPMREGQALSHITLLKNGTDTVSSAFLDLQPELWNRDYTVLTLWLDPGRIKRDLQPNQKFGNPLEMKTHYRLVVSGDWTDTRGAHLREHVQKDFVVSARDGRSPNPKDWTIKIPKANGRDPLLINFHESLDRILLIESIQIVQASGRSVGGTTEVIDEEATLSFTPETSWKAGHYDIRIEGRLEDMAGNNLNRVFDRDIETDTLSNSKEIFTRPFDIR
jgi:hypothetical protein